MISTVIVNLNEADKLEKCFRSLDGFAEELVVLDLGSTDATAEVCKKYQAKLFKHNFVPYVEKVRNIAVAKAKGDWILVLDPDETITSSLRELLKLVVSEAKYQAVNIPRKNIFFGQWIAHTNWWPDYHTRFFKKGSVKWSGNIHQYPEVSGKVLNLQAREDLAIMHFGYESITQFLKRQNRYSGIEAGNLYSGGVKFSWFNFFWKPTREFLVRFIRHAGFLDGIYGFGLTILMMMYQTQVLIKLWEKERQKQ